MSFSNTATYLVEFGVPSAVFTAVSTGIRAWFKRRQMAKAEPEVKTDTSMTRMAKAAIVTDQLIDNLQAENDRLHKLVTDLEASLGLAKSSAVAITAQLVERTGERDLYARALRAAGIPLPTLETP